MTEEIREIIDKLKDNDWYEELDLTGTKWIELKQEETHLLLNYITNLQKKNRELKDTIKKDNHLLGCNFSKKDKYKQERNIYKQRNEKAVEYINLFKDDVRGLDDMVLLNILQGGDE